jgi:hypothetical protein
LDLSCPHTDKPVIAHLTDVSQIVGTRGQILRQLTNAPYDNTEMMTHVGLAFLLVKKLTKYVTMM